jgi:hypothetical protein
MPATTKPLGTYLKGPTFPVLSEGRPLHLDRDYSTG